MIKCKQCGTEVYPVCQECLSTSGLPVMTNPYEGLVADLKNRGFDLNFKFEFIVDGVAVDETNLDENDPEHAKELFLDEFGYGHTETDNVYVKLVDVSMEPIKKTLYPMADEEAQRNGWVFDFKFLRAVKDTAEIDYDADVSIEDVESILLVSHARVLEALNGETQ